MSTHAIRSRLFAVLLAGLAISVAGVAPAAGARAEADASIRAADFSPATPGMDIYLTRISGGRAPTRLWLSRVGYGAVSSYQPLTPGLYSVVMQPAGAGPNPRPVQTWTLLARPGAAYTVAGVGAGTAVRGVVLKDDLTSPPSGHGRVRVVQAASRAPVVEVTASDGSVIAPATRFASVSGYLTLPAGRWTVRASSAERPAQSATGPVSVRAGQITSILLLDARSAGITLRTVLDSSSTGPVSRAAVDAGAGGTTRAETAPRGMGGLLGLLAAAAAAAVTLAAGALLVLRRSSGPVRSDDALVVFAT